LVRRKFLPSVSSDGYVSLQIECYRVTDVAGNFSEPSMTETTAMTMRLLRILRIAVTLIVQSPQEERVI
jgi:hypothetical protein